MNRLLLIDGHSLVYRSFFAFIRRPLRNAAGMNTSAVFGFANTLRKLLAELDPDHAAVVFDGPGPTFRNQRFSEYKIQRPPVPAELPPQLPWIKRLATAWGIRVFEADGVEADDVLATLATRFATQINVVLASSDKDLLQLVSGDAVRVYDPWRGQFYTPDDVVARLGVPPEQVVDYLALAGDASDNLPGVPGIGPKRAIEILRRFGSLIAALEVDERVKAHREIALLSYELARVRTDVPLAVTLADLRVGQPDRAELARLLRELEFRTLLKELGSEQDVVQQPAAVMTEKPTGRAFGVEFVPGEGLWIADDGGVQLIRDISTARKLISDGSVLKVGFDLKQQLRGLKSVGIDRCVPLFDVGVGAWLVDPERRDYGPEAVALLLPGAVPPVVPSDKAALARTAWFELDHRIAGLGLRVVCDEIEMPLVPVLQRMEDRGIGLDIDQLATVEQELAIEVKAVEAEIYRLAGHEFNIASPRQLAAVLFDELDLVHGRRMRSGRSTASPVLRDLLGSHPIVAAVLRWRELTKLCNTYLAPLRTYADPATRRVHPTFNQTGTATGRLSCANPNLQNVPIRSEAGRRIRYCFCAAPANRLISADYSQIELRVLAHISGDEQLIEAFRRGEDIHTWTAAAILGIDPEMVGPDQRRLAKVVNYGLIYGMGDFGLAARTEISREEARVFLDRYMGRFVAVARWMDKVVEQARSEGVVRTITGRMRAVAGVVDRNRNVSEAARRAALNAPIQGSAADIIKRAMLKVEEALNQAGINPGLLLQVHDELVLEVPESMVAKASQLVRDCMEHACQLEVPLVVSLGSGKNWGEAH